MKAVTVRGVSPQVADKLKSTAQKQGKSINQLMIEILKQGLGLQKEKKHTRKYDDLDHLFGSWTEDEFIEIHSKTEEERQIDQELWN